MASRSGSGRSNSSRKSSTQKTWTHVQLSIFCLLISIFLSVILGFLFYFLNSLHLPDISIALNYQPPAPTTVLADDGTVMERIYRKKSFPITLDKVPPLLTKAFIAAEDARFRQHNGIDIWAILRAFIHNIRADRPEQGGSTITQQTARMLMLNREKNYIRKIKEAILAIRLERMLTKDEIMRIYLNRIYLGERVYGVEAAGLTYFDKHASELNLAEIAIIAGLPQAPSRYSPFNNFALAKRRQAYVLNRMSEEGYIKPSEAQKAYQHNLLWASCRNKNREEKYKETGYFCQHVRNYITDKYSKKLLYSGGLTIYTTLDPAMQKKAVASIRKGISRWEKRHPGRRPSTPQAALVAIEIGTGEVKALVGGAEYSRSQFNRVIQAKRQPGSAFKPVIYAAALEMGYTPVSIIDDKPLKLVISKTGKTWQPHNFSDNYYGPTTLYTGIVHSRNIVTVKLLQKTGISKVKKLAQDLGIKTPLGNSPALALGTSEVTLLELTAAYTAFANQGKFVHPLFVKKIKDRQGKTLEENNSKGQEVLSKETSYQLTYLLQAVITEGTGKLAWGLESASAGKTGTTDNLRDGWFIGYTPELATGIWMGFDKRKTLGEKETGGRTCAPVWLDFMKEAENGEKRFSAPEEITFLPFNRKSGRYNPGDKDKTNWLPFKKDSLPWDN
ncbi:MAG: PBP1A family penicillin-binding protein [Desulfobia sp.]